MSRIKKISRNWWLIGAGAVLLTVGALLAISGFAGDGVASANSPQDGDTATVFVGDLSSRATASGSLEPGRSAMLSVSSPGIVEQLYVRVGDDVLAGEQLLRLDDRALTLNVATAEQALALKEANLDALLEEPDAAQVAAAEAAVDSAEAALEQLRQGPRSEEVALSEANLRAAESSLRSSSADLSGIQDSISDSQVKAAEAALLSANISLQQAQEANERSPNESTHEAMMSAYRSVALAQAQLNSLLSGPDSGQLGSAQGNVTSAAARVDGSQADLALLLSGASAAELAAAESQLAQAQSNLSRLLEGATEEQITVAQAEVEQARLTLMDAREALAEAAIVAPFDGQVASVRVGEGELATGAVIELINVDSLQVVLEVDEVDIGQLAVGQPATISLEAWPSQEIESSVSSIAPKANANAGSALVTYEVRLSLGDTELPVRPGMTASAKLTTSQHESVLLVPNEAISVNRTAGSYSVNLISGDTVQVVPVTIGKRDERFTQIVNGLSEGDRLAISNGLPTESLVPTPGGRLFGGGSDD